MTAPRRSTPGLDAVFDVTGWSETDRADLVADYEARWRAIEARSAGTTTTASSGFNRDGLDAIILRLEAQGRRVQAEAMRAALDCGGSISREGVYTLGGYGSRSLRGFTRPINRVVKELIAAGTWPAGVKSPFRTVYKDGGKAVGFRMTEEAMKIWTA